jgi:EmrB/QacA subfamily drug resistance transporter
VTDAETIFRRRWAILVVLNLSVFLVVVDNTIVNVALPTLSKTLHASDSQLQWIVDAYSLAFAGLLLAFGSLGDRFGRKGALQLGLAAFGGFSVLAAVSHSAVQLIAARVAMGTAAAMVFPATLAILTNVFTIPAERAKAIGIWAGIAGLAVALGPVSGGWLLEHFWWGSVFFVNVPIAAVALLSGRGVLPTSKDPHAGRLDPVGLVTSVVAVTLLVYTVIEAPRYGWATGRTIAGFVVAALLLGYFVWWESHRRDPMLDVRIFSNARFTAASASIAIAFFALFGFVFLITLYFQLVRGYATLSAGVHTLPFAFGAGVASPLGAQIALKVGTKVVVAAGLVMMALGFVWAATVGAGTAYWGPVVGSMLLIAVGLGLCTAPATESIMGSLPPEKAGVGSAVNDTTRELGGAFGVAVMGSVFSSVYGPRIVDLLRGTPLPAPAVAAARESVAAALGVAAQAPAAAQHAIIGAAQSAFLDGMHAGSWVAAGAALVGAVVAIACLPARAASKDVGEEIGEDIGEGEDVAVADADAIPPPSTALA